MNVMYLNCVKGLSLTAFYGALIYYFYKLDNFGVILTLILTALTLIIIKKYEKVKEIMGVSAKTEANRHFNNYINIKNLLLPSAFCVASAISVIMLFQSQTAGAIISPWETVPWQFFITFVLTTLILIIIALKNKLPEYIYFILYTLYFMQASSIAVIVYQSGFGFDPFIHQAAEKLISAQGLVEPKTPYYLGQYSLVVILHTIFFIPIVWLDKLLVPFLAAVFLPYAFFKTFESFAPGNKIGLLSAITILILPFSIFTITTPQNLAYLFLILLILFSLIHREKILNFKFLTINSIALAALAVHPIAGIPAVLFAAVLYAKNSIKMQKLRFSAYGILFAASALALPLAFFINNRTFNQPERISEAIFSAPKIFFSDIGSVWLNFSYLYGFNIFWLLLALIAAGLILARHQLKAYAPYLLMSLSLTVSFFITKTLNFSYLIAYEQNSFAGRILALAAIFSLPFIMLAIFTFIKTICRQNNIVKHSFLLFIAALISVSLYHSYPRFDGYHNSRSYSASKADFEAVRWIAADAKQNEYIALANQQVSAAALKEFGFKKYYKTAAGELFYYPIPTGAPTYQYYLDMVYKEASKKTALKAAELTGVDTAYFVVNKYWFGFEKILAEAAIEADEIKKINNGEVFVFKYVK